MNSIFKKAAILGLLLTLALSSLAQAAPEGLRTLRPSTRKIHRPVGKIYARDLTCSIWIYQGYASPTTVRTGSTVTNGDPVIVAFQVRNNGNLPTTFSYQRSIASGGQTVLNPGIETMTLQAGESQWLNRFSFTPNQGVTQAALWVDGGPGLAGQVHETNEANNYASVWFSK